MGLFGLFKKKSSRRSGSSKHINLRKKLEGPTFLEGYIKSIGIQEKLLPFEWKGKLQSPSGGDKFRIKYYGQLYKDAPGLLIGTDFAPLLVVAVDVETGNEILLFDGCRHGYNAMFCDTYTKQQLDGRIAEIYYGDQNGNDVFEIALSANYQMSEEEFLDMVDENGYVELIDGTFVMHDVAWRNCFDIFQICAIRDDGEIIEIVSEELA